MIDLNFNKRREIVNESIMEYALKYVDAQFSGYKS